MGLVQAQLKAQHEVLQLAAGCLPLHPPLAVALSHKIHPSSVTPNTVLWSSEGNDSEGGVLWQLAAGSHEVIQPAKEGWPLAVLSSRCSAAVTSFGCDDTDGRAAD